jgi:hypothetical protein
MTYPFIQAKHFTTGRGNHSPRIIVIHTMETPETEGRAKQVATWFAGATAPQASAHYCVDNKTIIQSVKDTDTAWAVDDFGLNQQSISIELAGTAGQNTAQWHDSYSKAEFAQLVSLVKALSVKYGIPANWLNSSMILDGKTKGFCGHHDITVAKKIAGGHSDPGVNFPMVEFLQAVAK